MKKRDLLKAIDRVDNSVYNQVDNGSILGWFVCLMASSSFTYGCDYDWKYGRCECKGSVNRIWRR